MKDRFGFEQGRRRDKQGRPLKLQTPPASEAYRDGWDRMFGAARREEMQLVEHLDNVARKGLKTYG